MTMRDFIRGELVDVVEWLEDSTDTMVWRFARPNNEIKNGAQLIVRPGQVAVFVEQGDVADVFAPGRHQLATENLPVLSRLRGWKYGFQSPFKAEVVFVSTRQFTSLKWGTRTPVMLRDATLGPVRLRAYGTYSVRVADAPRFVRELVGAGSHFEIEQISEQLRNIVVARFSDLLAEEPVSALDLAARYTELGDRLSARLGPELFEYGLEAPKVVVENVSLPDEVAGTLDQRTRMGIIGDVGAYAALQAADAIRDAARNPGSGGAGAAVGVGIAMAQQLAAAAAAATAPARASGASAAASTAPAPAVPTPGERAARTTPPPIPGAAPFWLALDGMPAGPFDRATLAERVRAGTLTPQTLAWREGMAEWAVAGEVPELASLFSRSA